MKWFKHDCDMHTDLKIQSLMTKYGLEGYAVWNLCLEMVGKEGKKGKIDGQLRWQEGLMKIIEWSDNGKMKDILNYMAELGLINSKALKYGNLHIPRFIKRVDDYTARQLRTDYEHDTEKVSLDKTRIDKTRIDKILYAFLDFKKYPKDKEMLGFYYKRHTNTIKQLLLLSKGDAAQVIEAMKWFGAICDKRGLSWTLETIMRWFPEFLVKGKTSSYDLLLDKFNLKKE